MSDLEVTVSTLAAIMTVRMEQGEDEGVSECDVVVGNFNNVAAWVWEATGDFTEGKEICLDSHHFTWVYPLAL